MELAKEYMQMNQIRPQAQTLRVIDHQTNIQEDMMMIMIMEASFLGHISSSHIPSQCGSVHGFSTISPVNSRE
ncbi:hypothetical protein I3842_16G117400 [Carya illinoinensis]|uniref:Uncharacterized protein n=1 Tax=Carya illinoinensis TaxID=32201 RepID=A0A922D9N8_CARIL|nr:hypothetical protein I3842_16G117400 [Carya illinoinensis]